MNEFQDGTYKALEHLGWKFKKILEDGSILIDNDLIDRIGIIDNSGEFLEVNTIKQYNCLRSLEHLGWYLSGFFDDGSILISNTNDDKTAIIFEDGNLFSEKTTIESRFIN